MGSSTHWQEAWPSRKVAAIPAAMANGLCRCSTNARATTIGQCHRYSEYERSPSHCADGKVVQIERSRWAPRIIMAPNTGMAARQPGHGVRPSKSRMERTISTNPENSKTAFARTPSARCLASKNTNPPASISQARAGRR
ncbi:hypothetical protein SDC9_147262 [bioreactor metagenome]|uniref:Uncharacterized protein n=1 Tax=bioreactor metagenome TaxID=1076179 RepID=A0A645EDJ0_9ZZZZ